MPTTELTPPELRARLADGSLAGPWALDPGRSSVELRTRAVFGLAGVKGRFGEVAGEAVVSGPGEISGTITVGASSLSTGMKVRDTHLRSADFFDAENHPAIVFTVQGVALTDQGATVSGTLQVRDQTRPLTFPATVTALDDQALRLDAEVTVDRSEFGLSWKKRGATTMANTIIIQAVFTRG
jgi:polyisoprenoid-binding protein YceI